MRGVGTSCDTSQNASAFGGEVVARSAPFGENPALAWGMTASFLHERASQRVTWPEGTDRASSRPSGENWTYATAPACLSKMSVSASGS